MTASATDLTVRKTIVVATPVERAWEVFTARMGDWWPGQTHSPDPEQWAGGRITADWIGEIRADGSEVAWGSVQAFEPPHRLVIDWLVSPERRVPTRIEVTFTADGEGTRVELVHSGFEVYDDGVEARASYQGGWDVVLGAYAAALAA